VEFGFDGKTLIHPRQIEPCHAAFRPDEAAVAWARRIVEAFEDPENASKGAIRLDGRMVERLHSTTRIACSPRPPEISKTWAAGRDLWHKCVGSVTLD
jgi:citrate lyase beta subunit